MIFLTNFSRVKNRFVETDGSSESGVEEFLLNAREEPDGYEGGQDHRDLQEPEGYEKPGEPRESQEPIGYGEHQDQKEVVLEDVNGAENAQQQDSVAGYQYSITNDVLLPPHANITQDPEVWELANNIGNFFENNIL